MKSLQKTFVIQQLQQMHPAIRILNNAWRTVEHDPAYMLRHIPQQRKQALNTMQTIKN